MKLTKEQEDIIINLYNLGVPKTKIMQEAHCSRTAVYNCIERYQNPKIDSMINQKFGLLTVLERASKRNDLSSRCIRYKCQCECGNIVEVDGNALRTGHTKSCGCIRKNSAPYIDLTGQQFGKLKVLYLNGSDGRRKIWHCKCECGNECNVTSNGLLSGHTKSCGCLHSYKEIEIEQILQKLNISYIKEYTFTDLRGKRNPLRFDFAIFNDNTLLCMIEYQGDQHFNIDSGWHTEQLIDSDIRKKEYCSSNNIDLYELTKRDNLEERLREILNNYGYQL